MTARPERADGASADDGAAPDNAGARGGNGPGPAGSAAGVLADRMAAALVHREPGWKLPRRSALARRFSVSLAEIDVAVEELSRRSLLRKLPDGQLYRASPAEYQIPIEGLAGLSTTVDPMGSAISCRSRHVSRRQAPQDICWALGLSPGTQVRVIRCLWTSGGRPVAMSTAYVPHTPGLLAPGGPRVSAPRPDDELSWAPAFDEVLTQPPAPDPDGATGVPDSAGGAGGTVVTDDADLAGGVDVAGAGGPGGEPRAGLTTGRPAALNVELRPPQPSIARGLQLAPGQSAITVTIRFDAAAAPVALTVVMLRPDFFKVSVETAASAS
ncbi:MAG TPA: UTRA domain-containing protein [Streptosporangiaceae bacterium]